MADLLSEGGEWLRDQLREHLSRSVTYRRGSSSVTVSATVGTSLLRVSDRTGHTRVIRTERDYLIAAEDLDLGSGAIEPTQGDYIDDDTDGRRFEVRPPPGEPAWRYSDARQKTLRIHTKGIADL